MDNNMEMIDKVAVIIPVFNSEKTLIELVERCQAVFDNLRLKGEIFFVDDGSIDDSWKGIKELTRDKSNVRGIKLRKNYGQHHAILCGLNHAQADVYITLDDDLEYAPEDIELLIKKYQSKKTDLVYGIPLKRKISWFKKILIFGYRILAKWTNSGGKGSSFRLLSKSLRDKIITHKSPFVFIDEYSLWYVSTFETVDIICNPSRRVKSSYQTWSLIKLTTDLVLISSNFPLKLVTRIGSTLIVVNLVFAGYYIIRKLFFSIEVEGYTSLIVSILFSTGLILFSLGIIAQYLSKIMSALYHKPAYSEEEIL